MRVIKLHKLIEKWLPKEFEYVRIWDNQIVCTDHSQTAASVQLIGVIHDAQIVLLQKEYYGYSTRTPVVLEATDPEFFDKLYRGLKREQDIMVFGSYASKDLDLKHTK